MQLFLNIFHVSLSIALILIILLQPGKDQGAVFGGGGGGNKMYAPRGQNSVLSRATTLVAVMFMFTSISLAYYSTERARDGSNIEDVLLNMEEEEEGGGFFDDRRPAAPAADSLDAQLTPPAPEPSEESVSPDEPAQATEEQPQDTPAEPSAGENGAE